MYTILSLLLPLLLPLLLVLLQQELVSSEKPQLRRIIERRTNRDLSYSTRCFDVRGWHDSSYLDCDWYAWGDNCIEFGFSPGILGLSANEACCSCRARLPPKPDSINDDLELMVMVFQTKDSPHENSFWLENVQQGRIWNEKGTLWKKNERHVYVAWIPASDCTTLKFLSSQEDGLGGLGELGFVKIIIQGPNKDNEIYYNWDLGRSFSWTGGQECDYNGFSS